MESTEVTPLLVVRAVLELAFLLAVVWGLLRFTDLRKRLFALGAGALVAVYVFVGASGFVQMIDRWQYDYPQKVAYIPFTRFAMYQAQLESSVEASYSWQGTRADGSQIELNIAKEFSAVGLPPMSTRMRVLMEWMHEGESGEHYADASTELRLYAEGLNAALQNDGQRYTEIGFYRVTGTPSDVDAELLISFGVEELTAQ